MEEILKEWRDAYEGCWSHQRLGQSLMNTIYFTSDLGVYDQFVGTEFDCFYLDSRIPKTLVKLQELLSKN